MKVYSDMKGTFITIRNPVFKAGTEFMVIEHDTMIVLQKIRDKGE